MPSIKQFNRRRLATAIINGNSWQAAKMAVTSEEIEFLFWATDWWFRNVIIK